MFKPLFQQTVTFDRVFDIHRWGQSKSQPAHTTFGFSAEGKSHYFVVVPGSPTIESGTTVTALLREPDNWITVVGWVNATTRQIAAPDSGRQLGNALTSFGVAAISAIFSFGSESAVPSTLGQFASASCFLVATLMSVYSCREFIRYLSYTKQLESLLPK